MALSANFVLYGDMSDRMMTLAAGLGPTQEIYSIDESFIGLHGVRGDLVARGRKVRERILQWTGIPTCIGMAPTKTLAKLANHIAKTSERKPGSYPSEFRSRCSTWPPCLPRTWMMCCRPPMWVMSGGSGPEISTRSCETVASGLCWT